MTKIRAGISLLALLALLALPPLFVPAGVEAAGALYRYTNGAGDREYSYTLPPGQVKRGYDKIDPATGQLIESVPPELASEERAENQRREQALRACRDELDRLYTLYSSERDIDYAQNQVLGSLETRIAHTQANLAQTRQELERLQSEAALSERTGRQITPSLMAGIQSSRAQVATLEEEIEARGREQQAARERYGWERQRFLDGTCPKISSNATVAAGDGR